MKLFQRNKYKWDNYIKENYQFLIIKNWSFLHITYVDDSPCLYTGMRIVTELLSPDYLFGIDFDFKGYSLGFWFFTRYWND